MTEQRSRTHNTERRAEALKDELGAMIEGELADPRIGSATVSEVAFNAGAKSARVYVRVLGDEHAAQETKAGLDAAKGYIRLQLQERLGLRHVPDLNFVIDHSETYAGRIDDLLHRVEKRDRKRKSGP